MKKRKPSPDPRKVQDLKERARQDANRSEPESGATINSVLYGAHTENGNASGTGEFDN